MRIKDECLEAVSMSIVQQRGSTHDLLSHVALYKAEQLGNEIGESWSLSYIPPVVTKTHTQDRYLPAPQ